MIKRIEKILCIFISPPSFNDMSEENKIYLNEQIKNAMGKVIPYEKVPIEKTADYYLRIRKPELWEFRIFFTNIGEKVVKQYFYEGFEW